MHLSNHFELLSKSMIAYSLIEIAVYKCQVPCVYMQEIEQGCSQGFEKSQLPRISALQIKPNLPHIDSITLSSTLEQAEHAFQFIVKHTRSFLFFLFALVSILVVSSFN